MALTTVQAFAAILGAFAKDVATTTEATKATTKATGTLLQTMLRPFEGRRAAREGADPRRGGGVGTFVQYAKCSARDRDYDGEPQREGAQGAGADVVLDYRAGHPDGGGGGEERRRKREEERARGRWSPAVVPAPLGTAAAPVVATPAGAAGAVERGAAGCGAGHDELRVRGRLARRSAAAAAPRLPVGHGAAAAAPT